MGSPPFQQITIRRVLWTHRGRPANGTINEALHRSDSGWGPVPEGDRLTGTVGSTFTRAEQCTRQAAFRAYGPRPA